MVVTSDIAMSPIGKTNKYSIKEEKPWSTARKTWVFFTWSQTWLFPNWLVARFCGLSLKFDPIEKETRQAKIMAWREKFALCMVALWSCAVVGLFVFGLSWIICPPSTVKSTFEVGGMVDTEDPYVIIYGGYYSIKDVYDAHTANGNAKVNEFKDVLGKDVSEMFFPARSWSSVCPNIPDPGASWDNFIKRVPEIYYPHYSSNVGSTNVKDYLGAVRRNKKGLVGYPIEFLSGNNDPLRKIIMIREQLYDVSSYFQAAEDFFDPNIRTVFTDWVGKDATPVWRQLEKQDPIYYRSVLNCMNNLFFIGVVDHRNDFKCQLVNWILLSA